MDSNGFIKDLMENMLQANMNMEAHFREIREGVIGNNGYFRSPYGTQKILYADWMATGRLYRPIEEKMMDDLGPYLANTHSRSEEHTSELQSRENLVCRLLLEK